MVVSLHAVTTTCNTTRPTTAGVTTTPCAATCITAPCITVRCIAAPCITVRCTGRALAVTTSTATSPSPRCTFLGPESEPCRVPALRLCPPPLPALGRRRRQRYLHALPQGVPQPGAGLRGGARVAAASVVDTQTCRAAAATVASTATAATTAAAAAAVRCAFTRP